MTARDVTGFYAFFSARKSCNCLHILGRFSLLDCTVDLEKKEIHWRNFKKIQISVPCRGRTCPEIGSMSPNPETPRLKNPRLLSLCLARYGVACASVRCVLVCLWSFLVSICLSCLCYLLVPQVLSLSVPRVLHACGNCWSKSVLSSPI